MNDDDFDPDDSYDAEAVRQKALATLPPEQEPCCDGCACDGCWKGWVTLTKKERAMARLEHITFNDVEVEHIPPSLFRLKVEMVLDWLLEEDPPKTSPG